MTYPYSKPQTSTQDRFDALMREARYEIRVAALGALLYQTWGQLGVQE